MGSIKAIIFVFVAIPLAAAVTGCAGTPGLGARVVVVAETFSKEAESLVSKPDRPVYYVILGGAEYTIGDSTRGMPKPDPATVEAGVAAALKSAGFVPAEPGGPVPSIAIVYSWGEANLVIDEFSDFEDSFADPDDPFADPDFSGGADSIVGWNVREMRQLVGADKPASLTFIEADAVNDAVREDRLYITIAALDVQELVENRRKLLWRTRISIGARRQTLSEALPVMLASGAPLFGSDSDRPLFIYDRDREQFEVLIGDLMVVDEEEESPE